MQSRRQTLQRSAAVAGLLASAGFPQFAHAALNKSAFEAKAIQDAVKAAGGASLIESKDVSLTAPDIAENGAVVPRHQHRFDWCEALAAVGGKEPAGFGGHFPKQ